LLNKAFKYTVIVTIPSIAGLLVLGRYFLVLFFGYSYLPASLALYFLAALIFPAVCVSLFSSLFSAEEKPEIFAKLIVITSILNVIFNYVLIKTFLLISPVWATAGASIAIVLSWLFYFFFSAYYIKKEFSFEIEFREIIKPLISSIIMAGVILVALNILKINVNVLSGALLVIIGAITYLVSMILLKGVKKEDLSLLKLLLKR
jgi:O-antigen/teichoic acid export membrane protein